jgi:hypothetical protein
MDIGSMFSYSGGTLSRLGGFEVFRLLQAITRREKTGEILTSCEAALYPPRIGNVQ